MLLPISKYGMPAYIERLEIFSLQYFHNDQAPKIQFILITSVIHASV